MVLIRDPQRGKIGPSLRGLFYAYQTEQGFKVTSWPKKRGKPKTPEQAQAQALFKQACQALKRMPAPFLNYAREQAKGTPMLPRDYLMAAGYGRGRTLKLPNGERRYWMATRVDMSMLMDNIGDQEGMLLYRGPNDLWLGLAIGEPGQVLQVSDDQLPQWADPTGGGGGGWRWATPTSLSSRAFNTKGVYFNPMFDGHIDRIGFTHDFDIGQNILVSVLAITTGATGTVTEVLYQEPFAGTFTGNPQESLVIPADPIPVVGGQRIAVCVSTTGQSGTYATRLFAATSFVNSFPIGSAVGYAELTNAAPSLGSVLTTISGTSYAMHIRGSF